MTKAAKEPTKLQKDWIRVGAKDDGWRAWSDSEKIDFLLHAVTDQKNWLEWLHPILLGMSESLANIAETLEDYRKVINDIGEVTNHNAEIFNKNTDAIVETVGDVCKGVSDLGSIVNHNAQAAHALTEMLGLPTQLHDHDDLDDRSDCVRPTKLDEDDEDDL